ncbi:nuclear pore complex protein NUP50B-like [Carex rostrata]
MAESKKRVAFTQLTRDDPDPDDNEPEPEMGSFKKASEEVMATRRVVKVKRAPQQAAPSVNPFSGIRLVPPTADSTSQETEIIDTRNVGESKETEKIGQNENEAIKTSLNGDVENGEGKEIVKENKNEDKSSIETGEEGKAAEAENTSKIGTEEVKENDGSASKEDVESKTESQKETGNEHESKAGEKETVPDQAGSMSSFGQLSSGQNAFKGLAGTGFSTSSFSFGSVSTEGSAPISAFSNAGSVFGSKPDSSLKEVPIETGEENEKTLFTADAMLFEYLQGGWKERGKGEVKLNLPVSDKGKKPRLVMRTKGNYRLVLNASLYPDMALKDMDKKGVTFACLNSAGEGEAGSGFSTFALKFREGDIRDDFSGVVSAHKGEKKKEEADAVLKNPENSPKESNE